MSKNCRYNLLKKASKLLINAGIKNLKDRSVAVMCQSCQTKRTNYMTECCHKPICLYCFSRFRKHEHESLSISSLVNTSDWGRSSISFICPFCGKEKAKSWQTYDPDSMAAAYQALTHHDEEITFVVRIDNPEEKGSWT